MKSSINNNNTCPGYITKQNSVHNKINKKKIETTFGHLVNTSAQCNLD